MNQEEIDLLLAAAGDVKNGRTRSHVGAAVLLAEGLERLVAERNVPPPPIPMWLSCPHCKARHIDVGEFATKPHHTHACQSCGLTWRPSIAPTVGVRFLPGFKNDPSADRDHPEDAYADASEEAQHVEADRGPGTPPMVAAWNRASSIVEIWESTWERGRHAVTMTPKSKDDLVRQVALALLEQKP